MYFSSESLVLRGLFVSFTAYLLIVVYSYSEKWLQSPTFSSTIGWFRFKHRLWFIPSNGSVYLSLRALFYIWVKHKNLRRRSSCSKKVDPWNALIFPSDLRIFLFNIYQFICQFIAAYVQGNWIELFLRFDLSFFLGSYHVLLLSRLLCFCYLKSIALNCDFYKRLAQRRP